MARPTKLRWAIPAAMLLVAALALGPVDGVSQSRAAGSIEGRLTDLYSKPLNGVRLVLRNVASGAEFATTTGKGGSYRLEGIAPGAYVLEAESGELGSGQTSGIVVSAGHVARIQTALALRHRVLETNPELALASAAAAVRVGGPAADSVAMIAAGAPGGPTPVVSLPTKYGGALLAEVASASMLAAFRAPAENRASPAVAAVELEDEPLLGEVISGEELEAMPLMADGEPIRMDVPPQPAGGSEMADAGEKLAEAGDRGASQVDGMSMRLAFGRGSGRGELGAMTGPAAAERAIGEARVIGSGGLGAAGVLAGEGEMRTRGGGDFAPGRLRGQFSFFDRQGLLNARNPSTQWVMETAPAAPGYLPVFGEVPWSPQDRAFRWNASLGGPVRRDRLFWFGAVSGERRDGPAVATVRHSDHFFATPALDEMQVLAARLDLPSADPVGEGLAAYGGMLETLAGLLGPAPRTSARWAGFGRVDWNAARHHRFLLEGSGMRWDAPGGGLTRAQETYGSHSFAATQSREMWLAGRWDWAFSTRTRIASQVSLGAYTLEHPPSTPSEFEKTLNVNPWGQLPQMVVDSRYGFSIGNPARFGPGAYPQERLFELRETAEWLRGPLALIAAADVRHNADQSSFVRNHLGTYHYSRIENFASDALVFAQYGLSDALNPKSEHNCDQRGKAWRDGDGQLHGLGPLPCYSYYTQTLGPTDWHLETNDWSAFGGTAWQPHAGLRLTAALHWDRQQMPPPIALVSNGDLPGAGRLPDPGNEWAPRLGLAWGSHESRWPVFRLGYGMYYGRVQNRTLEQALTQTGSPAADRKLLLRPTDNLATGTGGAPPFPYVLAGSPGTALKPGVAEVAPGFRNAEVHQAAASVEKVLPGHVEVSVSGVASLGRRLPVTMDTNIDPGVNPGTITYEVSDPAGKGPLRSSQVTVPFYAAWPSAGEGGGRLNANYQEITQLASRANLTYEAGVVRITRRSGRGVAFNVRYTYGHARDWNPNESGMLTGGDVFDPLDFRQEYGASNLDIRHSVAGYAIWQAPWKLSGHAGGVVNGWLLSGIGQYHSGLPYSMRTAGSIPEMFDGGVVVGLGPGMNGYGGADRVYGVGRNTFRYPATWKADVRAGKRFALGHGRELEVMAESFNLFNHRNVTQIETVGYTIDTASSLGKLPRLNFLTNAATALPEFGQPLDVNATDYYRERQVDFGFRLRFKH